MRETCRGIYPAILSEQGLGGSGHLAGVASVTVFCAVKLSASVTSTAPKPSPTEGAALTASSARSEGTRQVEPGRLRISK